MSLYEDLIPAVEQQLASAETPFVSKTLQRLIEKESLEEDEAKKLVAECLGLVVDHMYKTKEAFNAKLYEQLLKELPEIPERI